MTGKAVLGFAFTTFVDWVSLSRLWCSPKGTHVESRARVVKENEKHFAPEMLVQLVIDKSTEGATCLCECGRGTGIAEKCRDDNDLFDEFEGKRGKRRTEVGHTTPVGVSRTQTGDWA